MRAIITGATGFIGRELVNELLKNKIKVIVIVRQNGICPQAWNDNENVEVVSCDLCELYSFFQNYCAEKHADIFYHLGWYGTSGTERADITGQLENVKNTCDAVKTASFLGCTTFVNAGSIMEYEVVKLMTSEKSVPNMSNIYSTAKLTADYMGRTLANHLGLNYINAVISNIYGVGEKSARFLNTTLRKMLQNEKILLTHGEQLYDFIYITDAVKFIRIIGTKGIGNENYYIGNNSQKPLKDYLMKIILKSKSELVFGAIPFNVPTITYKEFDACKIENEFGIKPAVTFEDGILKIKEWILEQDNE